MAQTSFPWTSVGGDRTVSAADAVALYSALQSNGVLSGLTPTKDGSTVDVAAGVAMVNGVCYVNSAEVTLTPSAGTRKDYIVVRLDVTNRTATLAVLEGTSGAFPSLTRVATTWELAIASVDNSGGLFVVADTRADFTLCGMQDTGVQTTGMFTAASGWTIASQSWRRVGDLIEWRVSGTRSGATLTTTNARGNIGATMLNVAAGFRPAIATFHAGLSGNGIATFEATTAGLLTLSSVSLAANDTTSPWDAVVTGDAFYVSGSYVLA